MKVFILNGLFCLLSIATHGQALSDTIMTPPTNQHRPATVAAALACKLTDKAQAKRRNELQQTLFRKTDRVLKHEESYEVIFEQPDDQLVLELLEFIRFERQCCPWLAFQITFQPAEGPVSVRMGNSAETRQMAGMVMGFDEKRQEK